MLNFILQLDSSITNFINTLLPHSSFFDLFFSFFSLKGSSILIWLIIIVFLVIFEERKYKRFIIYFFVSFLITAFLVNVVVKNIVKRPRPIHTNSKSKTLNSKQYQNLNDQKLKRLEYLNLGNLDLFRISDFGFRIYEPNTCPSDYSFPSGHTATAFASAATLSYFDKKRKWFYYFIASLIGLSRIYLFCHFFLDVVGGAMLGYLISKIIVKKNLTL